MTDPMITAANTLEASPKPSYGPHKANERYLDDEDRTASFDVYALLLRDGSSTTVFELLEALETLRTHLRKKYYGG